MKENSIVNHPDTVQDNKENKPALCLLVDDITLNLKVLAAMVKRMDCIPVVVNSAAEALVLLTDRKFQLILTDLWMPEMNGMEFARIVRQNPEYNHVPIIAVTADVECESNFDMQYFDDVLVKPVNYEKLQEGLQRYHI